MTKTFGKLRSPGEATRSAADGASLSPGLTGAGPAQPAVALWYPVTAGITGLLGTTFLFTWWSNTLPEGEALAVLMMGVICLVASFNFLAKLLGIPLPSWHGGQVGGDGSSWRDGFSDGDGGD